MTQMGLDYLKHAENVRHNQATEAVDQRNATSNERNAGSNELNAKSNQRNAASNERNAASNERNAISNEKTAQARVYEASFADEKVAIAQQEADAKDTANKISKEANAIRRDELDVKQQQADAQDRANEIKNRQVILDFILRDEANDINMNKVEVDRLKTAINKLSPADAAYAASEILGYGTGMNNVHGINAILDQLIPSIKLRN